MLPHEDIMDGIVAEVTRHSAPLDYVVPAYPFEEISNLFSLPDDVKDTVTNGWVFETLQEVEEYLAKPAQPLDELLEALRVIQDTHARRFLESKQVMGVGRFIQYWRNTAKEYIRGSHNPSFLKLESVWMGSDAFLEVQSVLIDFLDVHIRESDAFVWGVLQKAQSEEDRKEIMVQRLVGVWSTLRPLSDFLELDINSIDGF